MQLDSELKFRCPAASKLRLAALGKPDHRNASDMCRIAIEEYLRNHDPRNSPNLEASKKLTNARAHSRTNDVPGAETLTITFDLDRLFYPADIAYVIGMSAPEINALRAKGCAFNGKKTTIRRVRECINPSGD